MPGQSRQGGGQRCRGRFFNRGRLEEKDEMEAQVTERAGTDGCGGRYVYYNREVGLASSGRGVTQV